MPPLSPQSEPLFEMVDCSNTTNENSNMMPNQNDAKWFRNDPNDAKMMQTWYRMMPMMPMMNEWCEWCTNDANDAPMMRMINKWCGWCEWCKMMQNDAEWNDYFPSRLYSNYLVDSPWNINTHNCCQFCCVAAFGEKYELRFSGNLDFSRLATPTVAWVHMGTHLSVNWFIRRLLRTFQIILNILSTSSTQY